MLLFKLAERGGLNSDKGAETIERKEVQAAPFIFVVKSVVIMTSNTTLQIPFFITIFTLLV